MQHLKKFLLLCLSLLQIQATTITCPTINQIKHHDFNGWLPLYKDNEELASDTDTQKFIQAITQFDIARWDVTYLETAHCFYVGTDSITDNIILAHDAWRPLLSENWQWIITNKFATCQPQSLQANYCEFIV